MAANGMSGAVLLEKPNKTRIHELTLQDETVFTLLGRTPEAERPAYVREMLRVGACCVERASNLHEVDFVRHQIEQRVQMVITEVGRIPALVQQELLKRIGSG